MTRVVVHIDGLVLNGFRREDGHAIALGLQEELGRVLGDREAVRHWGAVRNLSRLQPGNVHIEHGLEPQRIGANVVRGIHREIKK